MKDSCNPVITTHVYEIGMFQVIINNVEKQETSNDKE